MYSIFIHPLVRGTDILYFVITKPVQGRKTVGSKVISKVRFLWVGGTIYKSQHLSILINC